MWENGGRSSPAMQFAVQPGAGVHPMPFGGSRGDVQGLGGFLDREPGEVAKFHESRLEGLLLFELLKSFVQSEQVFGRGSVRRRQQGARIEFDALPRAAPFAAALPTCSINQDAAHGLGGSSEKVAPAVPMLDLLHIRQTEVGFVKQRRRLPRL